jgi:glutathione synthase/RimK-type ligase-like ATP-grasp enzyme
VALATSLDAAPPGDLALAQALRRREADVTVAVWSSTVVDWSRFDLVVIRSCWDYHLRLPDFLEWIASLVAAGVKVLNAPPIVRWNAPKTYLRAMAAHGIMMPETCWLAAGQSIDVGHLCRERGWSCAVVKPIVSATAYRTERRRDGRATGPAMVQAYQAVIEREGEWSVVYLGGVHSHDVRKRARADDFRVQSAFGGTVEVAAAPAAVVSFADAALSCVPGAVSLARVDVLHDGTQSWLMEVEAIEPELFLDLVPGAAARAASAILEASI